MGISLGYTLAFLNIFELIFAILPLILIWTIQDEEDGKLNEGRRCFSSCHRFKLDVPVYFYFIIYAIWCISRVISSIIGLLIWTNQIKFSPDNLAVRYLFGSSGESSQSTLVQIVINSILISLQVGYIPYNSTNGLFFRRLVPYLE